MSRKTSALAAIMIICSLYVFFAYIASQPGRFNAGEPFGAVLGILLFPAIISAVIGLVAGAISQGAFKGTFYWAYIALLPLWAIAFHIGAFN